MEEQIGSGFIDGHVAKLIDGEELRFEEGLDFGFEPVGALGGQEGIDQINGSDPADGIALLAGVMAQSKGQVGFTEADVAEEEDITVLRKPVQMEDMLDLGAIDLFWPGPIKIIYGFNKRETGVLNAALQRPISPLLDFTIKKPDDDFFRGPLVLGGLADYFGILLTHKGEFQSFEFGLDVFSCCFHGTPWVRRFRDLEAASPDREGLAAG